MRRRGKGYKEVRLEQRRLRSKLYIEVMNIWNRQSRKKRGAGEEDLSEPISEALRKKSGLPVGGEVPGKGGRGN